ADDDRLAVPGEPRRHEVWRAVRADRGQPDHRFRLEEPFDAKRGGGAVHDGSIGCARAADRRRESPNGNGHPSASGSDPRRHSNGRSATLVRVGFAYEATEEVIEAAGPTRRGTAGVQTAHQPTEQTTEIAESATAERPVQAASRRLALRRQHVDELRE